MKEVCAHCANPMNINPMDCPRIDHWRMYTAEIRRERDDAVAKLEQHDDDRDKLDVAEWLERYQKVKEYKCHGCGREYTIPTHLTHFTCICGHRCRLRHLGGRNPDEAVIDAAIRYFGTERSAQLAWIAEVVGGKYCEYYTADDIRKMIRQEMDRWELTEGGWRKK